MKGIPLEKTPQKLPGVKNLINLRTEGGAELLQCFSEELPIKVFAWSHCTEVSITVTSGGQATHQTGSGTWQHGPYSTGFTSMKDERC